MSLAHLTPIKQSYISDIDITEKPLGLDEMLDTLEELQLEDEQDAYGILRPSEYAIETARDLLVGALGQAGGLPYGSVFPDGKGGLQIEWDWHGRQVHLGVPSQPSGRLYIYYSDGSKAQLEKKVSGLTLAHLIGATRLSEVLDHESRAMTR